MTSSRWVFTLNNHTSDEVTALEAVLGDATRVRYGVFGREVGSSGTPHLQGFVILESAQRLSYLRRHLSSRAHFERARGTSVQARDYCQKDGDFVEFGTFPDRAGQRNDLEELIKWSDEFTQEHGRPPSSPDIAKHQPRAYLKYPRFRALAAHRAPPRQLEFGEPNSDWQRNLIDELEGEPDDRRVTFVVDCEGGKGKTWMCRYLLTKRPVDVQVLGIGRKNDLAHMVDETKTVFLFNIGRNQMEYLSYAILEELKDRLVVSTKYSGSTKLLKPCHVVVFSNEHPDMTRLTSTDGVSRYNIVNI